MFTFKQCLSGTQQHCCSCHAPAIAAPVKSAMRLTCMRQYRAVAHAGLSAADTTLAAVGSRRSRQHVIATAAAAKKQQSSTASPKGFGNPSKSKAADKSSEKRKCPCGSGQLYLSCCGRYHAGALAPSPEALLRARFSAYAMQHVDYLVATTHKQNPEYTGDAKSYSKTVKRTAQGTEYLGLKILDLPEEYQAKLQQSAAAAAVDGDSSSNEQDGYLKFSVRWRARGVGGAENVATEVSHFKKVDGAWLYYAECE